MAGASKSSLFNVAKPHLTEMSLLSSIFEIPTWLQVGSFLILAYKAFFSEMRVSLGFIKNEMSKVNVVPNKPCFHFIEIN